MNEHIKNTHDCKELMKQVMIMLDGEMDEQEEKIFMTDVKRCSHCLELFHIEKSFKEYICKGVKRKHIPAEVLNLIREKIKAQLNS